MELKDVVAMLNPAFAMIFALTFFLIWSQRRQASHVFYLAIAYLMISLGLSATWLMIDEYPLGHAVIADTLCTLSIIPFAFGVVTRHQKTPPTFILTALVCFSLTASYFLLFTQPTQHFRILTANVFGGFFLLFILSSLWQFRSKSLVDKLIFGVLVLTMLQFFIRPIFTLPNASSLEASDLQHSVEWAVFNFITAITVLLTALALIAACAMDVFEELKMTAATDMLTGIANRAAFEKFAQAEIEKSNSINSSISIIFCDIDHFKQVNDKFGHACGDEVIKLFAAVLRKCCRSSDMVGRIGGEEFAILLPNATAQMASLVAEAARTSFTLSTEPDEIKQHKLSASFGVAECDSGEDYASWMKRCDKALYKAKHSGRNCVRVAETEEPIFVQETIL